MDRCTQASSRSSARMYSGSTPTTMAGAANATDAYTSSGDIAAEWPRPPVSHQLLTQQTQVAKHISRPSAEHGHERFRCVLIQTRLGLVSDTRVQTPEDVKA
jgi:hypothetical protein